MNITVNLSEKDLIQLNEFLRRWNKFNKEQKMQCGSLEDAATIILGLALEENPAEKYYPNYK